ncbi:MAG: hypothetical protein WCQ54_02870 [Clostridiaceae bacterium]
MINIGTIKKEIIGNSARVSAEINFDGYKKILFFETSQGNAEYLCDDKADGFLLGLIVVALKMHSDITIESPVSQRLLYGLNTFLIPALLKMNPEFENISIYPMYTTNQKSNKFDGAATAISCGVDSFYTVLRNIDLKIPDSNRLTHLVLFNAGNFGLEYEDSLREFQKQIEFVKPACNSLNLPLIWLNSNLMEFVRFSFEQVHTFCNISCALALQNLITTFYYSSGHSIEEFKLSFSDSSHYDLINEIALKTESFEMISFGGLVSRFNKTKYISDSMTVKENLNVCVDSKIARKEFTKRNCSKCFKCIRTMTSLDVLGTLGNYDKVFDLNIYYKNKSKYWGDLRYIKWRTKDEFAVDIISNAKSNKYKIPKMSFLWMIYRGIKNQIDKLKR